MTTPATAAGVTPAPQNVVARFLGIIGSPRRTFEGVAALPKWFVMLALCTVLAAIFTALPMTTSEGQQATIAKQEQQMESFGMQISDQLHEQMEKGAARLPYTTGAGVLVVIPIVSLIVAGIFFAVFNAGMGGEASFKQVYSIIVHAGVISALGAVFSGLVNYVRHDMGSAANLGSLLPMVGDKTFLGQLLGMVDLFTIWWVIVLAIGMAVLYRRRTQPIAITLLSLYGVIAVVVALVKSRLGGA